MCHKFLKTGDASSMLSSYLSVITKGSCANDSDGLFLVKDFDTHMAYFATPISGKCFRYNLRNTEYSVENILYSIFRRSRTKR